MKDFIVYTKRGRMFLLALISSKFTLLGAIFIGLYFVEESVPILFPIFGGVIVVLFSFITLTFIVTMIIPRVALVVSKEGISVPSIGLVYWEDIEKIDFTTFAQQEYIGVFTKDPELFIKKTKGIKKYSYSLNNALISSQINIPVKNLDCSMDSS